MGGKLQGSVTDEVAEGLDSGREEGGGGPPRAHPWSPEGVVEKSDEDADTTEDASEGVRPYGE